ncbi:DUF1707 domain-containing protein [[Kitasatospora] papulosa]|uniref:DUF1707 domain-containing protein n=1 Tax=Streptomyces TaxID=1883 RepID=UPI000A4B21A4|nr:MULTISPECIES: DUF1707 domain-containing protein [Streptomyces]MBD2832139.1 DUF1707 and DUF2154 domain-containing protein [Streptomyces pratensis]MCX4415847.1 DUF1707 domain-containing protein [[Kitasatospora] papulosa]MEE1777183.1 DUF1707 domain-containing protein [Streptomyces sp. JV181]
MRASDAERERVAETLREAVAEGRLEMDEFEQRLDATFKARTHGELVPLVRDLPASGGPVAGRKASSANWPARIGGAPTSSGAFAFWGGFSRKGRWTVGPRFTAFAMWGGGEIDLREAHFAERDVVIRCFTIMGGMQVTVPPDLNVQVNGLGIMGGFGEHSKLDEEPEPAPDAPRVRITGFALMGGVGVERKRSKAEKRRLQEEERRRLGKPDAGDGRKELG